LTFSSGPPGTGKTTTIAAAAKIWQRRRQPAWIIAHSNVAVKNIAEKLFKEEVSFKIIVSKGFHFEWYVLLSASCGLIKELQGMNICITRLTGTSFELTSFLTTNSRWNGC
jgi:hypothetical protein